MITVLSHFFIKDRDRMEDGSVRRAYGMLCSIVGILLNVLLFAGKYLAGVLSGSIAITADAFNNLSDAGSSFITLVGFRFSGMKKLRPPNEATRLGSESQNQLIRSRSWQHFSRMCGPASDVCRLQLHMM